MEEKLYKLIKLLISFKIKVFVQFKDILLTYDPNIDKEEDFLKLINSNYIKFKEIKLRQIGEKLEEIERFAKLKKITSIFTSHGYVSGINQYFYSDNFHFEYKEVNSLEELNLLTTKNIIKTYSKLPTFIYFKKYKGNVLKTKQENHYIKLEGEYEIKDDFLILKDTIIDLRSVTGINRGLFNHVILNNFTDNIERDKKLNSLYSLIVKNK